MTDMYTIFYKPPGRYPYNSFTRRDWERLSDIRLARGESCTTYVKVEAQS